MSCLKILEGRFSSAKAYLWEAYIWFVSTENIPYLKNILTFKVLITTSEDDIFFFFFIFRGK